MSTDESILFCDFGPNGVGKTTLLRTALRLRDEFDTAVYQKPTTRPPVPGTVPDPCESVYADPDAFARLKRNPRFRTYKVLGDEWGVDMDALQSLCGRHRRTFLSVASPGFLRRIERELAGVRVVRILVYADQTHRFGRIAADQATVESPEYRRAMTPRLLARYRRAPLIYDHVLLNIFDQATFERHIKALFQHYNKPHRGTVELQRHERRNQCFA
jgi:guanylate kinase